MTVLRVWFSFVIGWNIKLIPFAIFALYENQITAVIAGICNADVVIASLLAPKPGGVGPIGYDKSGNVMYEGTPLLLPILFIGFLGGLVFYPIIIFAILTIWQKFKANKIVSSDLTESY